MIITSRECVGQFIMTLRNHSDVIHGMCWDYDSPNLLVTGCDKGESQNDGTYY
jgi:hypothetical protein